MVNFYALTRTTLSYCCPCCLSSPPKEGESVELPTICQAPTTPESMHVPHKADDKAGPDANCTPELDHFDSLWKLVPHPAGDTTPPPFSRPLKPKITRRYRQTVALLEQFHVTYVLIREVFEGLSYHSQHWSEMMVFYYKVKYFVDKDSDKYFLYQDRRNVANDANFGDAKIAVDELIKEWEKLQKLLETEGVAGQMTFAEGWEEAVPHFFV